MSLDIDSQGVITLAKSGFMDGESGPFLRESASVNGPWTAAESKALWTTTAMYRNGTDLFVGE